MDAALDPLLKEAGDEEVSLRLVVGLEHEEVPRGGGGMDLDEAGELIMVAAKEVLSVLLPPTGGLELMNQESGEGLGDLEVEAVGVYSVSAEGAGIAIGSPRLRDVR